MSRFLIRPSVNCHNLASRVLGMALAIVEPRLDSWVRDQQQAWLVRYGQPAPGLPPEREVRLLKGAQPEALKPLRPSRNSG